MFRFLFYYLCHGIFLFSFEVNSCVTTFFNILKLTVICKNKQIINVHCQITAECLHDLIIAQRVGMNQLNPVITFFAKTLYQPRKASGRVCVSQGYQICLCFFNFTIRCWSCSDGVVFCFHFIFSFIVLPVFL